MATLTNPVNLVRDLVELLDTTRSPITLTTRVISNSSKLRKVKDSNVTRDPTNSTIMIKLEHQRDAPKLNQMQVLLQKKMKNSKL